MDPGLQSLVMTQVVDICPAKLLCILQSCTSTSLVNLIFGEYVDRSKYVSNDLCNTRVRGSASSVHFTHTKEFEIFWNSVYGLVMVVTDDWKVTFYVLHVCIVKRALLIWLIVMSYNLLLFVLVWKLLMRCVVPWHISNDLE